MRRRLGPITLLAVVAAVALTGCQAQVAGTDTSASAAPRSPRDAAALATLDRVAPQSVALYGGTVTRTACWTPSEHLIDEPDAPAGTFKVICRVHFVVKDVQRYEDTTCIGDFHKTPMLTHCYHWEYYSDEPSFADGARLASPPPTPFP